MMPLIKLEYDKQQVLMLKLYVGCVLFQAASAAAAGRTGGSPERWTDCL